MKQILIVVSCQDITGYSETPTEYIEMYNVEDSVSLNEFVTNYNTKRWNYDIVDVKNAFIISESLNPMEIENER